MNSSTGDRTEAKPLSRDELNHRLPAVVDSIVASVLAEPRMRHLNQVLLPKSDVIVDCLKKLRQVLFPGYFGNQHLTSDNVSYRIGELLIEVQETLYDQVRCCLRYRDQLPGPGDIAESVVDGSDGSNGHAADARAALRAEAHACDRQACEIVATFLERIPAIRAVLATDVQAAFESDPAARSTDETIFCYPGLYAISVQRMAHEFYKLGVPLLPRIMTEHAHGQTGIDIHPGAKLGESFFIDHGTGVVIGETTEIGRNVKLYQGVTLGAVAPAAGQQLRGVKRHPTIEDDVTIYAGATILGGDTIIGRGAVIGGNVFITSSVPPYNLVSAEPPKLKYRERRAGRGRAMEFVPDFQI